MTRNTFIAAAAAAALMAGCGGGGASIEPSLIETGQWRITQLRQNGALEPLIEPAGMTLSSGALAVDTGCTPINGRYNLAEGLRFTELRLPSQTCEAPLAGQQAAIFAALSKTANWTPAGDGELSIIHGAGVELMRLSR